MRDSNIDPRLGRPHLRPDVHHRKHLLFPSYTKATWVRSCVRARKSPPVRLALLGIVAMTSGTSSMLVTSSPSSTAAPRELRLPAASQRLNVACPCSFPLTPTTCTRARRSSPPPFHPCTSPSSSSSTSGRRGVDAR
jgi:hypothetical protein